MKVIGLGRASSGWAAWGFRSCVAFFCSVRHVNISSACFHPARTRPYGGRGDFSVALPLARLPLSLSFSPFSRNLPLEQLLFSLFLLSLFVSGSSVEPQNIRFEIPPPPEEKNDHQRANAFSFGVTVRRGGTVGVRHFSVGGGAL